MKGYTRVPNVVLHDVRLSPAARLTYALLLDLAWQAGRRKEGDAVLIGPLDAVSIAVGCSRTALKDRISELRRSGLLVTKRIEHQGMLYVLFDSPAGSDSGLADRKARAESALALGRNPAFHARARSLSALKTTTQDNTPPPPSLVRIDGRNPPLDALCSACGIDTAGPRVAQAAVALEGRGNTQGIRHLYWLECSRRANEYGEAGAEAFAALAEDPERFTNLLAARITEKARLILERDTWRSSLAPSHVRDLWLDVELRPLARAGALTPEEIERFDG